MRYNTKKILVSLESIALTDIVMNMFIFFFITFSLVYVPAVREKGIKVDLPKGKSGASESKSLTITITKEDANNVYFDNETIPIDKLESKIKEKNVFLKNQPITIRCDKDVNVDRMVRIMDIARTAGASKVNIAIEQDKSLQPTITPE